MSSEFVHLHVHSQYSLLDGTIRINELVRAARADGQRAVAVTDHGNIFAAKTLHDQAIKEGLAPIIGCELYVAKGSRHDRQSTGRVGKGYNHLILLAASREGYQNLVKLVSIGYTEGFYYKPRVDLEVLRKYNRGLIALSACLNGVVADPLLSERPEAAIEAIGRYQEIYGKENFYLELQDHGMDEDRRVVPGLTELSRKTGAPLVVTNDSHYLRREDSIAHDVLLCIQTGKGMSDPTRWKFANDQFYLKTQAEMASLFPDHPDALRATVEIAEKVDFRFEKGANYLPRFDIPNGETEDSYFERVVRDGFEKRKPALLELARRGRLRHPLTVYEERLATELAVISETRFPSYFLIVWDFMRHAREIGVPVGPGRGSAAGSLVAYCLRITDIDPIQYDLIFERFLNKERISMPDIDIDFCMRGRGKVIEYVTQKYGRESVAQIITFGTMAARAAIRDVGRSLELSYSECDRVAKLIPPPPPNVSIEDALSTVPALNELYQGDPRVKQVIDLAKRLEGLTRHASVHAAGVVIAPAPVTDFCALFKTNKDEIVTQFAKDDIERIGLLKMDFLGLRTLTVMDDCVRSILAREAVSLDLETLPLDDPGTFQLFCDGRTDGVFQFESVGMKDILRRLKPDRFEDLIALNALYRPGPMQMIDDYIKRRHGLVEWDTILPQLEPILSETYGVMVYQEQVMRIASTLAGFSLGDADLLRKAMGKKDASVMEAQRERFLEGSKRNKIAAGKAAKIFDTMQRFASYAFNKSHSTAYALLAYQTAYLKAHHPVHFMTALLTAERENTSNVVKYVGECREMGIAVLPPDVNKSEKFFTVESDQAIRFGLAAIKNAGEGAIEEILKNRQTRGPFGSLGALCEELDSRAVNKRVIESLIKSGALDSLGAERSRLVASLDRVLDVAQSAQRDRLSGQESLFGPMVTQTPLTQASMPDVPPWSERERLGYEKDTLGFYITGHPLSEHARFLKAVTNADTAVIAGEGAPTEASLGGMVVGVRPMKTKKGSYMAYVTFEDLLGTVELILFPDLYQKAQPLLEVGSVLVVRGKPEVDEKSVRFIASEVMTLLEARLKATREIIVTLRLPLEREAILEELHELFLSHRGQVTSTIEVIAADSYRALVAPHSIFRLEPTQTFVDQVEKLLGRDTVRLGGRGF